MYAHSGCVKISVTDISYMWSHYGPALIASNGMNAHVTGTVAQLHGSCGLEAILWREGPVSSLGAQMRVVLFGHHAHPFMTPSCAPPSWSGLSQTTDLCPAQQLGATVTPTPTHLMLGPRPACVQVLVDMWLVDQTAVVSQVQHRNAGSFMRMEHAAFPPACLALEKRELLHLEHQHHTVDILL